MPVASFPYGKGTLEYEIPEMASRVRNEMDSTTKRIFVPILMFLKNAPFILIRPPPEQSLL
jgi:hypothetical protein